ncbi:family 16 glycosylhydrolase [Hujiaoplasma nucleasis]|uniref:Family 16 glycosylhydrolase n=1 Tax=Hujiaoplasma nucleasis TaxID=2725268 RepID=A0A7L6N1T8_9MOLU|nr:family 16 glycosylhydrolase [Hujiaoplasma nucleasis]QLY39541.1 family 16 glycosylhydrolase [Hujiaoplasma nucleasis]
MKKLLIIISMTILAMVLISCQENMTLNTTDTPSETSTEVPTTDSMTTEEPTTEDVTNLPTDAPTEEPTTLEPTTEVPTEVPTEEPTTMEPTTMEPTTVEPTTVEPITEEPTTEEPTTEFVYDDRSLVPEECQFLDNIDDWQPIWCDEFNVDGLPDSSKWMYDVGGTGWGNNELQYYTNADLDNAFVEDGILNIRALKENVGTNDYTSARLITKYQGDWQYGRIQIRAKMPAGRGTWAAIWMLPTNWVYGGWPYSGEIDIMEYVGYDDGVIHGTIHTGAYNHGLGTQIGYSRSLETVEEEFHLYEMIWEPSSIKLFVDGIQFATFGYNPDTNIDVKNSDAWPFDEAFHLILNVAIGGNWGGVQGVDDSIFPTSMQVDYVRVFQKDYAGMDQENPTGVSQLVLQDTSYDSIRFKWKHATDDILVSHYNIYIDDTLIDQTTLNAIRINDLEPNTTYNLFIETEDFSGKTSPLVGYTVTTDDVPEAIGLIQAEDFYKASGVQTEQSEDDSTLNVGWIDDGDYMIYLLKVSEPGTYQISFRVASENQGGQIQLFTKNRFPHFTLTFEATGGWQTWTTVTTDTFTLTEGIQEFKILAVEGGFNLNYFEIVRIE